MEAVSNITIDGETLTDVRASSSIVGVRFHIEVDEGDTIEAVRFKKPQKLSRCVQYDRYQFSFFGCCVGVNEARESLFSPAAVKMNLIVSFVSPEAQFTPKQVETLSEREQLVFRVRVRVPQELVEGRIEHVKTGLRGEAIVRLNTQNAWPEPLERRIPPELFE